MDKGNLVGGVTCLIKGQVLFGGDMIFGRFMQHPVFCCVQSMPLDTQLRVLTARIHQNLPAGGGSTGVLTRESIESAVLLRWSGLLLLARARGLSVDNQVTRRSVHSKSGILVGGIFGVYILS